MAAEPAASADAGPAAPSVASVAPARDDLTFDLKHLAAFDMSPLQPTDHVLERTRDVVQLLVNQVFNLPRKTCDEGPCAILPDEDVFKLPRMKPIPKEKAKTRWARFMEERNMKKRKRSRLVYDEVSGDWKPRWGYKSAKHAEEDAQWAIEVKEGQNPYEDPFAKKTAEKKLIQAKQKMREVRNQVEAVGAKLRASVPDLQKGDQGGVKRGKEGLKEAMKRAQQSSASFGKFDRTAPNETTGLQQKQRKVGLDRSVKDEKDHYLKTATRVLNSDGSVDKEAAAKEGRKFDANIPKQKKGPKGSQRRSKQGGKLHHRKNRKVKG